MEKPTFDPGLTQQYTGVLKRAINAEGGFNVRRVGMTWRDFHPYLYLTTAPWVIFLGVILTLYVVLNTVFAGIYLAIGTEDLKGADLSSTSAKFVSAFFFSANTLTTLGYGNVYPHGVLTNAVASSEALVGLMVLALATGLFFGRFSRPSARIGFSEKMLIAPYLDGSSLQFRIVNRRRNNLIDLEARVLLMTVEFVGDRLQRRFANLTLERDGILFFPLTWTIVHPIDENSPLRGKTQEDLKEKQVEFLILIKGWDDAFAQTVHARHSYRFDEIEWGAKFAPAFTVDSGGGLRVQVNKVGKTERAPIAGALT